MSKKLLSLLLILGLILCLTISVSAEEVGGSFKTFTWSFDTNTGTLTIGGEGHMGSFSTIASPWLNYKPQIHTVIIEPGVTGVGNYAFNGCSALTSVTLPEGLTAIEEFSFASCTSLTKIQLPTTLESIGANAFSNSGLTSVTFPTSLKTIGRNAFHSCKSLTTVTIPGNVESIGWSSFEGCSTLLNLTIGDGVKEIDSHAFHGCSSLLNVTIPGSVKTWGFNSFHGCTNLRSAILEEGITDIPSETFYVCENLAEISLPSTLKTIGPRAFLGCKLLQKIVIPEGVTTIKSEAFRNCFTMKDISLPDTLTELGDGAFTDCDSLSHVKVPGSLAVLPNRAFENCDKLETLTLEEGITTLSYGLFRYCSSLKELNIPASVTTVGGDLCYDCENLKKVVFKSGTTSIGNSAFHNCVALEEIILPDTLASIGDRAFDQCYALKSIILPGSLADIGWAAFYKSGVQSIKMESGMLQLPKDSLRASLDLIYVVLPESLVLINDNVFAGCDKLCHALITGPETEIIVNNGNAAFDNSVKHFNAKGDEITIHEDCTSVYAYCSICDKAIYSETKRNAEHKFGDWVLTTPPTTSAAGEETRSCSVCDAEETRSVAKLPSRNPFTDVPEGSYYEEPVIWAVDEGITTGITSTTFAPMNISTRGQVVTFLWRCAGCPEPKTGLNPFDDVAEGKFYYKAVLWAVENGITNGTSDTTFSPDKNCTRGHVVTFLHRYQGTPKPESSKNPFTDVLSGKYYYDAVLWAVENGITNGTSSTTFSPDNECKRCEIVTFLYRALYK